MLPEVYLQCRIDMLEPEAMPCDGFGWSKKDPSQHACTTLRQVPRAQEASRDQTFQTNGARPLGPSSRL